MNDKKAPAIDGREWAAQERGMRAAHQRAADALDPAAENYRRVATALIQAPRSEPPADFAAAVAAQVAAQDTGIERALLRGLSLLLATSSIIVIAYYGAPWWQAMQAVLAGGALQWTVAATGCLALSWMVGRWQQSAGHVSG